MIAETNDPHAPPITQAEINSIALTEVEQYVVDRIEEAAYTFARLPTHKPAGYRGYWPDVLRNKDDVFAIAVDNKGRHENMKVRPPAPSPAAIDRAVEVAEWMIHVRQKFGQKKLKLVWRRAMGIPWDTLEGQFHRKRTALNTWRKDILAFTVLRLRLLSMVKQGPSEKTLLTKPNKPNMISANS